MGFRPKRTAEKLSLLAVLVATQSCTRQPIAPPPVSDAGIDARPDAQFPDGDFFSTELSLVRLSPANGPFVGGNRVVLRGTGFTTEVEVKFGESFADPADFRLIDSRRLEVVVPVGRPGPVEVSVQKGADRVSLPDGYQYDAIAVSPNSGSISGGTAIDITAADPVFETTDTVRIGNNPCRSLRLLSPSRIRCLTPPGPLSVVDVSVTKSDGDVLESAGAFTYYDTSDPVAGGLGGGPLNGTLNVTVLDAVSDPVDGALVFLGDDPNGTYVGRTNFRGQITFSGPELSGLQSLHVAKACYENASFVSFDASDVTVFLRNTICRPTESVIDAGIEDASTFDVNIPDVPPIDAEIDLGIGPLPQDGGVSADAEVDARVIGPRPGRADAIIQGQLIFRGPGEFQSGPQLWNDVPRPVEGWIRVAYVFTTWRSGAVFPEDRRTFRPPDPSSGGAARIEEATSPTGDLGHLYSIRASAAGLAVVAIAGLEQVSTRTFRPYLMGVARDVFTIPAQTLGNVNIQMNHPLDRTLGVTLTDLPPPLVSGPNRFRVEAFLDLGGEGVLVRDFGNLGGAAVSQFAPSFDRVVRSHAAVPFLLPYQASLSGSINDTRYRIYATWLSNGNSGFPLSTVTAYDVSEADSSLGDFLHIPVVTSVNQSQFGFGQPITFEHEGDSPEFYMVLVTQNGFPVWRSFVRGNQRAIPMPDLRNFSDVNEIQKDATSIEIWSVGVDDFSFDQFTYRYTGRGTWRRFAADRVNLF